MRLALNCNALNNTALNSTAPNCTGTGLRCTVPHVAGIGQPVLFPAAAWVRASFGVRGGGGQFSARTASERPRVRRSTAGHAAPELDGRWVGRTPVGPGQLGRRAALTDVHALNCTALNCNDTELQH